MIIVKKTLSCILPVAWLWAASLLIGPTALAAVEVNISSPSFRPGQAAETTLAPTRDFYVEGSLSGAEAAAVRNLIVEVYHQGVLVRRVTTDVHTASQAQNQSYQNLENHGLDLDSRPMADLVWDGSSLTSFRDPGNKGILYQDESGRFHYNALIQGGITKSLDSSYADENGNSLTDLGPGQYTVKVIARDGAGQELASSSLDLTFAYSNMAFFRFTDQRHINNMRALAGSRFKILDDPLPGNWWPDGDGTGAEIKARWKANDFLEYSQAPKVIGAIYDIAPQSAAQMELATVIDNGHLESAAISHQTYLYHYDLGDSLVEYQRRGGVYASAEGRLVLFGGSVDPFTFNPEALPNNSYARLALTRAELYAQGVTAAAANVNDLRFKAKQVQRFDSYLLKGTPLVFSRPGQTVGVLGVTAPIPAGVTPDPDNDTVPQDLLYLVDNRLGTIKGTLSGPDGQSFALADTPVEMLRFLDGGTYGRTSIYEFKAAMDSSALRAEGVYNLALSAYDLNGQPVSRAQGEIAILVTRTGLLNGSGLPLSPNQSAVGDAFLDMLIDANVGSPELAWAYMNTPRTGVARSLTDLSGAVLLHRLDNLAENPLRPVSVPNPKRAPSWTINRP